MTLNSTTIKNIIAVSKEIFSQQTQEDVKALKEHFGKAYNELDIMASIAVELGLRLYTKVDFTNRAITPVSFLSKQAENLYIARYAL